MVLFIVALLLGGLLPTLSSQVDQRHVTETRKQLDEIQQALIGFAVANGRLPCPAVANATGMESPAGGNCTSFSNGYFVGFVPAATLGLSGTWFGADPVRYKAALRALPIATLAAALIHLNLA